VFTNFAIVVPRRVGRLVVRESANIFNQPVGATTSSPTTTDDKVLERHQAIGGGAHLSIGPAELLAQFASRDVDLIRGTVLNSRHVLSVSAQAREQSTRLGRQVLSGAGEHLASEGRGQGDVALRCFKVGHLVRVDHDLTPLTLMLVQQGHGRDHREELGVITSVSRRRCRKTGRRLGNDDRKWFKKTLDVLVQ
jgi:hypothetical protein